jgi:hypothetical protein
MLYDHDSATISKYGAKDSLVLSLALNGSFGGIVRCARLIDVLSTHYFVLLEDGRAVNVLGVYDTEDELITSYLENFYKGLKMLSPSIRNHTQNYGLDEYDMMKAVELVSFYDWQL